MKIVIGTLLVFSGIVLLGHFSTDRFIRRCDSALTRSDMSAYERIQCLRTAFEIVKWQKSRW